MNAQMKSVAVLILLAVILSACTATTKEGVAPALAAESPSVDGPLKEVKITAFNFGFTQDPVTIRKGDRVRLRITSTGGIHGLRIPSLGLSTGAIAPGDEQVLDFVADKEGSFDYSCNVPCGSGHRNMKGTLVVEP